MDPPLSEDEDDESMYSSTMSNVPFSKETGLLKQNSISNDDKISSPLEQDDMLPDSDITSKLFLQDDKDLSSSSRELSSSASDTNDKVPDKINDEDIKVKLPLSASIMLTKLDRNVNDIITKLSEPRTDKVNIRFQPIGSIEPIHPKIFKISSSQEFKTLVKFLNKKLAKKIQKTQVNEIFGGHIFCYLHNSFTPGPEEIIGNLFEVSYRCFQYPFYPWSLLTDF